MNTKWFATVFLVLAVVVSLFGCGSGVKTSGEQSIYTAAEKGDLGAVRAAIRDGFKVNTKDSNGMTLLHHAAAGNQKDVAELLRERYAANIGIKDAKGRTPLDVAKESGSDDVAAMLAQAE